MAKNDPSVRTLRGAAPEYPEGTHPPAAPSDQAWGPYRFSYSEMPESDKPDESTVVQVADSDPLADDAQKARDKDAKYAQSQAGESK